MKAYGKHRNDCAIRLIPGQSGKPCPCCIPRSGREGGATGTKVFKKRARREAHEEILKEEVTMTKRVEGVIKCGQLIRIFASEEGGWPEDFARVEGGPMGEGDYPPEEEVITVRSTSWRLNADPDDPDGLSEVCRDQFELIEDDGSHPSISAAEMESEILSIKPS